MEEDAFWKLIKAPKGRVRSNLADQYQERLIRTLAKRPAQDIIWFEAWFTHFVQMAQTAELQAAARIMQPEMEDEGFLDFRGWLVCQGKKAYYSCLKSPDKLTKIVKPRQLLDWLGYGACAAEAYEQKTGQEMPPPDQMAGPVWPDNELPRRFPKLWQHFRR